MDGTDERSNADAGIARSRVAYTIRETAELLSLGVRKVEYLVQSGEIESFKIGKARRITGAAIEAFVDSRQDAA